MLCHFKLPHSVFFTLFVLTMMTSCSTLSSVLQASGSTYEDLSRHRIVFKAPPKTHKSGPAPLKPPAKLDSELVQDVTEQLDALLAQRRQVSDAEAHIAGFTIQVYTGPSRDVALSVRKKVHQNYPDLQADLSYTSTNYVVRVGKFLNKLEAQRVYNLLKNKFSSAIVRPISIASKFDIGALSDVNDALPADEVIE